MPRSVSRTPKRRGYDSTGRKASAQTTRKSILDSATRLFLEGGYAGTTMPAIAKAAGVALDTVYASVGNKATLFRLLVETAISGRDEAVPPDEREYVRAIRAEPDAAKKLQIYAAALASIQPRLVPLFRTLQSAAAAEPELRSLWDEISRRRAANMNLLAADLQATGQMRPDMTPAKIADVIWSLNSPEVYWLLTHERGWSTAEFCHWLADAWIRLLLE